MTEGEQLAGCGFASNKYAATFVPARLQLVSAAAKRYDKKNLYTAASAPPRFFPPGVHVLSSHLTLLRWRHGFFAATVCNALIFATWSMSGQFAIASDPAAIAGSADDQTGYRAPSIGCSVAADSFENQVWAKVGETICLRCHTETGDAADSGFRLVKPSAILDRDAISSNGEAFWTMALRTDQGESWLLAKASGRIDHGGGEAVVAGSSEWKILESFVRRAQIAGAVPDEVAGEAALDNTGNLFDAIRMISDTQLLRRVSLSLTGRLPTDQERADVAQRGAVAFDEVLDRMMDEVAFYDRLKEGFNDILLTVGIEDNAETILSYDHFEKTRLWFQDYDLGEVAEEMRERARWELARVYREALLREPYELIAHIVRNEKPFTEIVTADYVMVSPYTARSYGIFEDIKERFKNPADPFEFVPAKLKALTGRDGNTQESPTGFYPHSGLLSTFHYLRRYPSTETNRNRLRARMVYQHWLGVDVMSLAPRSTDATAVDSAYEIPTMQAADCVVCHKIVDPISGVFQDYDFEGHLGPRKEGWYQDMFEAGFEQESMPASERWRAAQWLGERLVADPRFAGAVVEHVYYILFGRKVMLPPTDLDDPYFTERRCAYRAQRMLIETTAERFVESGYNLKEVFKSLIRSDFYRADGLDTATERPERSAQLDDIGVVRLLSPEQLERKVAAIFGKPWGQLNDSLAILYGGIDSIAVTERNMDPSGAMGAVQRMLANDVACEHVASDFRRDAGERNLFPTIEPNVVPGTDEGERAIRAAIVHLHERLLGYEDAPDSPRVDQTFRLFDGIIGEAKQTEGLEPRETYYCGGRDEYRSEDPHFTLRAWRAVVTYLLRQQSFLYE